MSLLLSAVGLGLVLIADLPAILKRKDKRELIVYSVILLLVLVSGLVFLYGARLPSPVKLLQSFYRDILGLSFKIG
jgi:hypothetical protein